MGLESKSQVANYIANGSFEDHYPCPPFGFYSTLAKSWMGIDSLLGAGGYRSKCNMSVPLNGTGYQYPKTGDAYVVTTMFCVDPSCGRGYFKNRLKKTLEAGKIYCVKFHVNITNTSPRGMDGFGIYFADASIDTITKFNIPLIYLNPQVKNPSGNIISDTMNWVPITGTFVASGSEKYALIGNFLSDNNVTTAPIFTSSYPQKWTDVNLDDVSCIEVNLPAYAGPDKSCVLGDSVFIGRQPDFAVDPGCRWYKLPDMNTAIDTVSGLWVKPIGTTTYVVRQELDCSPLKWDTVVIFANPVGLKDQNPLYGSVKIYPVPAREELTLEFASSEISSRFKELTIYNHLGQKVRSAELCFKNQTATIATGDLDNGIYFIELQDVFGQRVCRRFVIENL